ncbi:MAG: permease [Chloroflexi bacterium]|nr:permease [Chloroflexota bacterium]
MKLIRKADRTFIILVALVLVAIGAAFWKGGWQLTGQGLVQARHLIETVWLRLLLGFTLAGLIQVVIPRATIARWLGPRSGIKGILIGSYTATIMTGAPFVSLPVVASLYTAGAGAGPMIALLTGTSLIGIQNLIVWQIPFLGVGVPLSKFITGLLVTPLAGMAGIVVFKLLVRLPDLPARSDAVAAKVKQADGEKKAGVAGDKEKRA